MEEKFTQQHGFIHAWIVSTVLDSACGYAAYSLMQKDTGVLSVMVMLIVLLPRFRKILTMILDRKRL